MTQLSVNINKIATLRNARGGDNPSVVQVALDCERFGAEGITVHPRPDERHITKKDVYELKEVVTTEFNIEGYPDDRFMRIVEEVRPAQATLVPDPPNVLTSNAGWDTIKHQKKLSEIIAQLKSWNVRTSIFVEPIKEIMQGAKECGTDRVELYTEMYASSYSKDRDQAVKAYVESSDYAHSLGLELNAGHDLDLENLSIFCREGDIQEVSIGHALISDALEMGLHAAVTAYCKILSDA